MIMVTKCNGDIKSRGDIGRCYQRTCSDKSELLSPISGMNSFKHACRLAAKESRDAATVDLPELFLKIEANEEDEVLILKIFSAVTLLLLESN